jgi:DNA polymerase III epsilon subunit-like protein
MNNVCSATNIRDSSFVAIDFETANPSRVSICAAGLAVFEDAQLTEAPYWLVRPPKGHGWFRDDFIECHGLTHLDVLDAPDFSVIAPEMLARLTRTDLVVAHNAAFDIEHLRATLDHFGLGPNKGKHVLYEGSEKPKYQCKFCGTSNASLVSLTSNPCMRHPSGPNKGKHEPAL